MHAPLPSPISPQLLLSAYRQGIFPMADSRTDTEIFWVEPRERAILPIGGFKLSRSLARTLRREKFRVTCNQAFSQVVQACAGPRDDAEGTWISHRIERSYQALHEQGHAHSIECWEGATLVGGVYGVGFDSVFCGESMFSRRTDASKVALAWLMALLDRAGAQVFDCQFMTSHLASLGAVPLSQKAYLAMVAQAAVPQRQTLAQAYSSLSAEAREGASDEAGADPSSSPGKLIAQSLTQTS